jgi:glutamine synthetase
MAMPPKLELSLDAAKSDDEFEGWIGSEMPAQYLKVNEAELEHFSKMTEEERRQKFLNYI